jgi:amidophosphoribosyltransferase
MTKKKTPSSCSVSSSLSSRGSSTSTSCERWDTHKKARSAQSWTGEQEEQDIGEKQPGMDPAVFSGSSFFASPEPSMLPVPAFFRSRGHGMMSSVPAY